MAENTNIEPVKGFQIGESVIQYDYNFLANLPIADKELATEGQFADSKAVGDAINKLKSEQSGAYLPLTGGEVSGEIIVHDEQNESNIIYGGRAIKFNNAGQTLWLTDTIRDDQATLFINDSYEVLHSGNYRNYAVGGVSSWNDLTDKPFGEFLEWGIIFEDDQLGEFVADPDLGFIVQIESDFALVPGKTYKVDWDDDGQFITTAYDAVIGDTAYVAIGDGSSLGYPGNNEPFVIGWRADGQLIFSALGDSSLTHDVVIITEVQVTKTIDKKYLPNATGIDLSAYKSDGIIVETFADGSSKTTTIEFDADGNPIKITDGDGNVTTLTW